MLAAHAMQQTSQGSEVHQTLPLWQTAYSLLMPLPACAAITASPPPDHLPAAAAAALAAAAAAAAPPVSRHPAPSCTAPAAAWSGCLTDDDLAPCEARITVGPANHKAAWQQQQQQHTGSRVSDHSRLLSVVFQTAGVHAKAPSPKHPHLGSPPCCFHSVRQQLLAAHIPVSH
jgi:hypothetical protein